MAFCEKIKPKDNVEKENEYFLRGLHPKVLIEMAARGLKEREEIQSTIEDVERLLLLYCVEKQV